MCTLKPGLPELTPGRQSVTPAKGTSFIDEQVHQEHSKMCPLLLIML